jgi:cell division septum initiation protein DivIVA
MGTTTAARVAGLEELAQWIAGAGARGAGRFELWVKVRGSEQERVLTGASAEPFDVADELLAHVERDRRVELGQAAYAVFAYREKDKAPAERAFVSLAAPAIAMPVTAEGAAGAAASPSAALASVLSTMQGMTRDVFGSLQRENEHQRKTNESMMKSSTGYFETFAKGYERTFSELQTRLDASLREASELRAKNEQLEQQAKTLALAYEELSKSTAAEEAATQRKEKRVDDLVEQAKVLAPLVIAKLGNKPGSEAIVTNGVMGALLGSISNDQAATILGALNDAQRGVLAEALQSHRRAQAKTKAASAASPGAQGFADGLKTSGQTVRAPAPATVNDAVEPATDRDFQRVFEVLGTQMDRYERWLENKGREIEELAAKAKKGTGGEKTNSTPTDGIVSDEKPVTANF